MLITIAERKALKGGKTKLTTLDGGVYYAEAGLGIPYGADVEVAVESVEKDGKMFQVVKAIKAVEQAVVEASVTPSLPVTSLPETKAPGGELPVKKAGANVKVSGDPDRMSKQDWQDKDRRIELTAIFKSTIESPALRELIIGKNVEESLKVFDSLVEHFLAKLDEVKGR